MSRSLLQANQAKKPGDNDPLKSSRSRVLPGKLNNFTQVLVQTNDEDFPFIAIYKPDIKKEQRRVQSITTIERAMRKFQLLRLQFSFGKLNFLRHKEQGVNRNVQLLQQLFIKMQNKRLAQGMLHLSGTKIKKRNVNIASKAFSNIESKIRMSNIRFSMNRLKIYNYQAIINTFFNQSELSRQLSAAKNQLFDLKAASFDKQFVDVTKTLQKLGDHNGFIDHIRQVDYQNLAKAEGTRFQQNRSKNSPKKKQPFESELIATALSNTINAYESCIADHINYEQDLKRQLQAYTNTQGINELQDIIKAKQNALNDLQSFVNEMTKLDAELKRFSGEKYNWEKILSLLPQQQKKLEMRSKKSQGSVPKLYNSRVYLDTLITNSIKRSNEEKEEVAKLLDELIEASKQQNTLRVFIKKVKDYPQVKSISTKYLTFTQKINDASGKLQELQSQKLNLLKTIEKLERQNKQNARKIKQISQELQSLKDIQEIQRSNIQSLQEFITENDQRVSQRMQLHLTIDIKLLPHIRPLFQIILNLLKRLSLLETQKRGYLLEIEELKKIGPSQYSENKPVQTPQSPRNTKIEIGESEQSLADRFMSPFKELLQNRHEDRELKQHTLSLQSKFQEILCLNRVLHEKLLGLQTSERTIIDLTARMKDLKQENDNLRKNIGDFNEMHNLYEQNKERILFLTEENARLGHLANLAAEHQYRFRELSIVNAELTQHVISLRQSNSQFNGIASTNLHLSQMINEMYNRNPIPQPTSPQKIVHQGNNQLLLRQTELLQQILGLKIELQNAAIKHLQEISNLKNEINSYHTIISKYEVDITHRETECNQKQSIIQSLNLKYQQLRDINAEQQEKIQQYEKAGHLQTAKKYKDNEAQLNILRQDCQNIYAELQRNIEHLRARDTHIHNLQINLGSQQEFIVNLRKQNERLLLNIQDLIGKNESLEQESSRYITELNQAKSQLHEIQMQHHRQETSQTNISHSTIIFQKEIQDKQIIINNLLEQAKTQSASFTAQLQQLKQEHMSKERVFEERLAQKDVKISKLEFELNEKLNTVMSLEQLISLYANTTSSETIIKEETHHTAGPYSRDQEILYLRGQIKSLEEFLNDMTNQYHELQKKYQQERERTNRAYLNLSPISPEKVPEGKDFKTTIFQSDHNREGKFLDDASDRFTHSFMSNINMTFTESDIARQLSKLMASNESLANSVDNLRGENKELFMKVKSISSIDMVIELVFNILLTVRKLKHESPQAAKIWHELSHLRSVYSGEVLFQNLEDYCRSCVVA